MIHCPNCGHNEPAGALFCSECGAKVDQNSPADQLAMETSTVEVPASELPPTDHFEPPATQGPQGEPNDRVTLRILAEGVDISLAEDDEFTLGRVSEGQPLIPEVDLGPFNAYDLGVSRLHAVISVTGEKVIITDLGSANGTWVNAGRVSPHNSQKLKDGDMITLGKLQIQVAIAG